VRKNPTERAKKSDKGTGKTKGAGRTKRGTPFLPQKLQGGETPQIKFSGQNFEGHTEGGTRETCLKIGAGAKMAERGGHNIKRSGPANEKEKPRT